MTWLVGVLWSCTATPPVPAGPPNLLVILADDLGVDNVSSWGVDPRSAQTPVLDALAADGVRFRNAWAYPECSPTRAALLTGRYGRHTGIGMRIGNRATSRPFALPESERILPEVLGRPSSMAGKWHLSNENTPGWETSPNTAGFDWYAGSISNLDARGPRSGSYFRWHKTTNGHTEVTDRYATADTTDDAIARTHAMPEPWLLYVAYAAPHAPFHDPPPEVLGHRNTARSVPGRYRAMVEAMDREIGRLLDGMDPGVRQRTTVIFAGDNGTPKDAVVAPQLRERAKNSMYEGGIRVPVILSGAQVQARGSWSDALVHVVDVLPTAAELAGVPAGEVDGISLVPALSDPHWSGREVLYAESFGDNGHPPYFRDFRAVRDDRHKLIRVSDGRERFFDLEASGNPLLEGEDLLQGELTPAQQASLTRLTQAMDGFQDSLGSLSPEP